MALSRRKWKWIIASIILLAIIGAYIYMMLYPRGPILDEVPNPIRDRTSKDWQALERDVDKNEQRDVYFGDMHVHTAFSFDAYIGGILPKPSDAYRFAKGQSVKVFTDDVRIVRPLDFAAVTDHAEYLGELYSIHTPGAPAHKALLPRYFRSVGMDTIKQVKLFNRLLSNVGSNAGRTHLGFFQGFETTKAAWDIALDAAEEHYDPGTFTTFAAYEWTLGVNRAHAHRNVFFKDMMVPDYPISAIEAQDEVALWNFLDDFRSHGATVMAVPHNSNLSEGGLFPEQQPDGSEIDIDYLNSRARNEKLVEIHQAKGNSEVHPALWGEDEFADFEVYSQKAPVLNNYVRHVLKRGLAYKKEQGINPYEYGIIGSTDTHNGTPGNTEEDDTFRGNHAFLDYNAELRRNRPWILDRSLNTRDVVNPGGLMAVWAKANTRPEIYEAMERKETYATSGGRIKLRFFAGEDLPAFSSYQEMLDNGYNNGAHMGQTINAPEQSPVFYLWAAKDPEGANLDRVQIIKGWYIDGVLHEQIYNAIGADDRLPDANGDLPNLDNSLDLETGEWDTSIGDAELSGIWQDPAYDSDQEAFYYMRVLEVTTPRWSLYDEVQEGVIYPDDTEMTIIERAWSSPIWVSSTE